MKLTNFIIDMGRTVAFYPNLKKITGSTTATLFLCQLLYWSPKSKDDGWIWKRSTEIEEETGLTYYEQKTARKLLVQRGLISEQYRRLDHYMRFRVHEEKLNLLWEEESGKPNEVVVEDESDVPEIPDVIVSPDLHPLAVEMLAEQEEKTVARPPIQKRGDLLDGLLAMQQSPGMKKMEICNSIRERIEKRLAVNADNKKWNEFIEFAYVMQENHKEPIDTFIDYAIAEGFNPVYWTPEKMRTLWPQAFRKPETGVYREDFVQPLPREEEKNYVPMPPGIGRKKEDY